MNKNKISRAALGAVLVAAMMLPLQGLAASEGYWYNSEGEVWRNASGDCWRTIFWSPENALPECEGEPAPEPEPAAPPAPKDSDGDGVIDARDSCPGTPPGVRVDARGCPLQERIILEGVNFRNDRAELTPTSTDTLNEVAETLRRYPELQVAIEGHTDSSGADDYNMDLSQRRAESVRMYLITKGIDSGRLTAIGYGEERPIASNATPEGRAQNRRVELEIRE
ncbi:MAG TPA: OmpA family protein [Thioalkalivibrio sp.]|nr:OmpA family protein [Thioalkalivibrio sp.]